MSKDLNTEVLFCPQSVPKSSYIVELYGLIDELSSALSFVLFYSGKMKIEQKIIDLLEETNQFLSKKIIPDISYVYFNSPLNHSEYDMKPWNDISDKFARISKNKKNKGFVSHWDNEMALWLNESRVRARRIERYMVSSTQNGGHAIEIKDVDYKLMNWLCCSQPWNEMISFFNKMSTLMFKIGVGLNGE
jgi:cob(I)alamin adenosyltransferase